MRLNTAFLLGAGFSYPAGIPMMKELARDVTDFLKEEELNLYRLLEELVPEVGEDFELLMECCYDLKKLPVNLLNNLYRQWTSQFVGSMSREFLRCDTVKARLQWEEIVEDAKNFDRRLKEYLRERCVIQNDKLQYLYPLMKWLKDTRHGIDIFSLNYDLILETLAEEFFVSYTDGFLLNWKPDLFDLSEYQLKIYKLHGSFIWYQSEWGERLKIPVSDYQGEIKYLTHDVVASMMIYPRREKKELFEELLRRFRERLLTLDRLVVIGYSFRDEEIKRIVKDAMRKNAKLHLTLVSPRAREMIKVWQDGYGSAQISLNDPLDAFAEDGGSNSFDNARIECFSSGVEEWITSGDFLKVLEDLV